MKKVALLIGFLILVLGASLLWLRQGGDEVEAGGTAVFSNIFMQTQGEQGKIDASLFAVFGPQICTAFGDALSPWNSPYEPGSYTYQYRIDIPANYAHDVVRVEIFDPDSMNSPENYATIFRTVLVQDPTVVNPTLGPQKTKTCGIESISAAQKDPCYLLTDETLYLDSPLAFNQINPTWYMRVDQNRGVSPETNGNGTCGSPDEYEAELNTRTVFELYYMASDGAGSNRTALATYTGQTGDARDTMGRPAGATPGDHDTDLYWISPGAENQGTDFDSLFGTFHVPVDAGSVLDSFEVDLTSDVPNIVVDSDTRERTLLLDITAVSGASLNSFAIWAGSPSYATTTPANINSRNVLITNSPNAHSSDGVMVTAMGRTAVNMTYENRIDIPIAQLGAEMSSGTVTVSVFDVDSGAEPPITFYMDGIPKEDWSLTFSDPGGADDPDGVRAGLRCMIGSCNDQWVSPPYTIDLPGDGSTCFEPGASSEDCVAFHGGTLMMEFSGGLYDTSTWEVMETAVQQPSTSSSCAAYPIGLGFQIRSVTPPGSGATPYPDASDFDYPASPPSYNSFLTHQPNLPLDDSTPEGTIFKYTLGTAESNFSWLTWNQLITPGASTLANSLTPPGNSLDYTDHGDSGTPHPDFGHVVRGYAEPGNLSDVTLNVEDLVPASLSQLSADVGSGTVNAPVNDHIDAGRILRLLVVDEYVGGSGTFEIERFALFKVHGYGEAGTADEWLLLEFIRFDESCGQLPPPPPSEPDPKLYLPLIYVHEEAAN